MQVQCKVKPCDVLKWTKHLEQMMLERQGAEKGQRQRGGEHTCIATWAHFIILGPILERHKCAMASGENMCRRDWACETKVAAIRTPVIERRAREIAPFGVYTVVPFRYSNTRSSKIKSNYSAGHYLIRIWNSNIRTPLVENTRYHIDYSNNRVKVAFPFVTGALPCCPV